MIDELLILFVSLGIPSAIYYAATRTRLRRILTLEISPRITDCAVAALVVLYTLTFGALSILRHLNFNTGGFDLGIFDQVVWNSLHGRLFENTILPDAPVLIGQRFSPMMLAFVPFYAVWRSPVVLLIVQTLGIAVSAFPLYWYARREIGYGLALVVIVAYLMFPALEYVNLFQFHEIALAIPLLAFATFFLLQQSYKLFFASLVPTLLVKEDIGLVVIAFGIYVFLVQRKARLGLALGIFGAIWSVLLLQYIIPYFRGDVSKGFYYFGSGIAQGSGRYDYLGHSLFEILATIGTRPDIVLQHLLVPAKLEFAAALLVPLVFLSLLGLEVCIIAFPTLALSLLSDYAPQFSLQYHYTAALIPFLFFAAVVGMRRVLRWKSKNEQNEWRARMPVLASLILIASTISYYLQAPGPFALHFEPERYALNAHGALGSDLMETIPPDAVVAAQTELASHLSQRERIYEFPGIPDYRQAEYLVADTTRFWYAFHKNAWDNWLGTSYFQIILQQDGYLIARRRTPAQATNIQYADQMTLVGYTIITTDTLRGGQTLRPIVEWRAAQDIRERYVVQVHLLDSQGHLWSKDDREPDDGFSPTDQWRAGQRIGDQYALKLPPTMPPGEYYLTIAVCNQAGRCLTAQDESAQRIGDEPVIARVHIAKDKSSITASELPIEYPYFVDMEEMRLLGFNRLPRAAISGETVEFGVYWRARGKPRGDYAVAVQLRDQNARVAFEQFSRPASGAYPTLLWESGEVLLDWHDLQLPARFPPGDYALTIVLRELGTDRILGEAPVTTITVQPGQ